MTQEIESHAAAAKQQKKRVRQVIEMVLGALFGAAGMMLLTRIMPVELLDLWEFIALTMAMMIALILVIVLVTAASRRLLVIRVFDGEADEAEIRSQRRNILFSAVSMAAMIPPLCILALPELIGREAGLAVVLFCMAVMTGAGWIMWREQDELHRMASLEGANIGLGIMFVGLMAWATLDVLDFGVPLQPLPVVVLMVLVVVMSSIIAAARRSIFSS